MGDIQTSPPRDVSHFCPLLPCARLRAAYEPSFPKKCTISRNGAHALGFASGCSTFVWGPPLRASKARRFAAARFGTARDAVTLISQKFVRRARDSAPLDLRQGSHVCTGLEPPVMATQGFDRRKESVYSHNVCNPLRTGIYYRRMIPEKRDHSWLYCLIGGIASQRKLAI